jgi:aldose 1-epimerase
MNNANRQFCYTHPSGEDIYLFTLRNTKGTEAGIINYGAILAFFRVKKADGTINDIVLGFDKAEDYLSDEYLAGYPYFGAAIGRYGNRIKNGEFSIDGKKYFVAKNKVSDHLHGGKEGFDKKVWQYVSGSANTLVLKYTSADGEEGYPGNLETEIHFELNDNNELIYEFFAQTDEPTAVNLTHHSYFNLNNGRGAIGDHFVKINSSAILEQDNNFVVTGRSVPVDDTIYDFRRAKQIGKEWIAADGYDQSFVLDDHTDQLKMAAEAWSDESKLKLEVYTTEPLVHFYTGKWIPVLNGKNGVRYSPFSGFCLETQKHPNAINIAHFPDTILRPGETYHTKTMYRVMTWL